MAETIRASAGRPKARVFPLPVSAIPTTSFPSSAGGQAHAWIGVGSLKPVNADRRASGIESWLNERMGVNGDSLWTVIAFLERNVEILSAEGAADDEEGIVEVLGSEDVEAPFEASVKGCLSFFSFLLFLSFLSFFEAFEDASA